MSPRNCKASVRQRTDHTGSYRVQKDFASHLTHFSILIFLGLSMAAHCTHYFSRKSFFQDICGATVAQLHEFVVVFFFGGEGVILCLISSPIWSFSGLCFGISSL